MFFSHNAKKKISFKRLNFFLHNKAQSKISFQGWTFSYNQAQPKILLSCNKDHFFAWRYALPFYLHTGRHATNPLFSNPCCEDVYRPMLRWCVFNPCCEMYAVSEQHTSFEATRALSEARQASSKNHARPPLKQDTHHRRITSARWSKTHAMEATRALSEARRAPSENHAYRRSKAWTIEESHAPVEARHSTPKQDAHWRNNTRARWRKASTLKKGKRAIEATRVWEPTAFAFILWICIWFGASAILWQTHSMHFLILHLYGIIAVFLLDCGCPGCAQHRA